MMSKVFWDLRQDLIVFDRFKDDVANNASSKGFRQLVVVKDLQSVATFTSNLHGEVSELWEAFRAGKMDLDCDKSVKMIALGLPIITCQEEEIADILIRTLDTAHAFKIDVSKAVAAKHLYNTTRSYMHGKKA